jgi:Class III cytochrome C family
MSRTLKIILFVNLCVIAILTFAYAHLMVAPGQLVAEHQALNGDCFACHTTFRGINSDKCVTCHKPSDIGRLTTKGLPLVKPSSSTVFHKELNRQECVSCHSDHMGVKRYQVARKFDHTLLKSETRLNCQTCHKPPSDGLHQQIKGECAQCHTQKKWIPATFEHDKFFVLDRDHSATCVTCHIANDYKRYTCYGCHEHTPANIRSEHSEEGIRNFENCVECHRSGDSENANGGEGHERD